MSSPPIPPCIEDPSAPSGCELNPRQRGTSATLVKDDVRAFDDDDLVTGTRVERDR